MTISLMGVAYTVYYLHRVGSMLFENNTRCLFYAQNKFYESSIKVLIFGVSFHTCTSKINVGYIAYC